MNTFKETSITKEKVLTIKTTVGELKYFRDWDNTEGGIVMLNPQTIKRYKEIQNQHPDCDDYGVWFAFNREQYDKGFNHVKLIGKIDENSKIQYCSSGLYGTHEGITAFFDFYENRDNKITEECDPQEVYFYEYNNHECMYDWDGDREALKLIIEYFGVEAAKAIKRYNAAKTIEQIIKNK